MTVLDLFRLDGKVALVTAAGEASAKALAICAASRWGPTSWA
jgi:hypothetical protein